MDINQYNGTDMWPTLKNSPVVLAVFQIRYNALEKFDITKFYEAEKKGGLKKHFPHRTINYNANILGLEGGTPAPGISMIKAKADTKVNIITYFSENKKENITINSESITYSNEEEYSDWNTFKEKSIKVLKYFSSTLCGISIERVSMRFVNRFEIASAEQILDYFNLTISSRSQLSFPIAKYSFKYIIDVPKTRTYAIINHATEPTDDLLIYMLDIDVLDSVDFIYDESLLEACLEKLREIKNTIFFENITTKTIELCNSAR